MLKAKAEIMFTKEGKIYEGRSVSLELPEEVVADAWADFRNTLDLTHEEEEMINLEKALINAIINTRKT